ncbi:MAG: Ig-like domain-containing protein [Firmicutes bacterium]|nr:Ig-like domain-containing protein [Bacillota bacterium]
MKKFIFCVVALMLAVTPALVLTACDDSTPLPAVTITPATGTLTSVGQTLQLQANVSVTWASNDILVATVSSTGLVTAVGSGSTIITATSTVNNQTGTATIAVDIPGTQVPTGFRLHEGQNFTLFHPEQLEYRFQSSNNRHFWSSTQLFITVSLDVRNPFDFASFEESTFLSAPFVDGIGTYTISSFTRTQHDGFDAIVVEYVYSFMTTSVNRRALLVFTPERLFEFTFIWPTDNRSPMFGSPTVDEWHDTTMASIRII